MSHDIKEEFKKYIKAVGTGPKGNRDLTHSESQEAMSFLLSGELPASQIAAFLIGFRLKPETIEEYRGALAALEQKTRHPELKSEKSFELGFPYDGKNDSPYLFPLTAKFLKDFHLKLVVCGDDKIPSKDGVTVKEFMAELGPVENLAYYDRAETLPELSRLSGIRNDLGLRTALNTLEKFSGIERSSSGATGVFHKPYVQKYCEIFKDKMESFSLFSANEGAPELYRKGRVYFYSNGEIQELLIDPAELGILLPVREMSWTVQEMAALNRNPDHVHLKLAALNSALYLYTAHLVSNWQETYDLLVKRYL